MSRVIQALLNRTLLATFNVKPPPQSIMDSLAVHDYISQAISGKGKIIHYRQTMCPVTKQRLPTLHVLLEDLEPKRPGPSGTNPVEHIYWPLKDTVPATNQSELEKTVASLASPYIIDELTEVKLERATRSQQKIRELNHVDPKEPEVQ